MIREFEIDDMYTINADEDNNPILKTEDAYPKLAEIAYRLGGMTYEDDGKVIAIIVYYCTKPYIYEGMLITDKNFKDNIKYLKHTKELIEIAMKYTRAKNLFTTSIDNKVMDRWHKFLGFNKINNLTAFGVPHARWLKLGDR